MLSHLDYTGVPACNQNPYLPALEDIGCIWQDVVQLMDKAKVVEPHAVFRKRPHGLSFAGSLRLLKRLRASVTPTGGRAAAVSAFRKHPAAKRE